MSCNILSLLVEVRHLKSQFTCHILFSSRRSASSPFMLVFYSPLSSGHDSIHHLDDAVQCRVGADGHVGATEVVVDGADHADNVQHRVTAGGRLIDHT